MKLLLALILSAASTIAPAGDLGVRIRPQLPDSVVTVRDAITYYAEPAGYRFVDHTPVSGDARLIAAKPALRPAESAPITTVEAAMTAVLPINTTLLVDDAAGVVAIGVEVAE